MAFKTSVCLIGFVCFVGFNHVLGLSEEMQELANMLHNTCQEETGVPEDMIVNARKGDFAQDNTLKCYMKCLYMQMAMMDEDTGKIDEDAMVGVLPDEHKALGEKVIHGCGTKFGSDLCDTAFQTNICYQAAAPEHYFLP